MEEDRRSFSDIAASYDAWAVAAETEAEEILASMDACAIEVQSDRRCRATNLMAEALEFKERAEELRKLAFVTGIRIDVDREGHRHNRTLNCFALLKLWL